MKKRNKGGGFFINREMYLSEAYLSLSKIALLMLNAFLDARKRNPNEKTKAKGKSRKNPNFINLDCLEMPYETLVKKFLLNRSSIPRGIDELMAKGFIKISYHGGACKHDRNKYALVEDYLIWKSGMEPFETRAKREKRGYQGRRTGATASEKNFICDYCNTETNNVKKTDTGFNSCMDCLAEGALNMTPEELNNHNAQNCTHTRTQNRTLNAVLTVLK
jgi:hypothetical protein